MCRGVRQLACLLSNVDALRTKVPWGCVTHTGTYYVRVWQAGTGNPVCLSC